MKSEHKMKKFYDIITWMTWDMRRFHAVMSYVRHSIALHKLILWHNNIFIVIFSRCLCFDCLLNCICMLYLPSSETDMPEQLHDKCWGIQYPFCSLKQSCEIFFFQSKFGKSVNCIYLFKSFCLYSIEYIQPQINVQFPSEDQQPQKISRQKSF